MSEIQKGFILDGKVFATMAEAENYRRRPLITAAFMKLTKQNQDLVTFLMDNEDDILGIYDTGTIRRVSKSEAKKLAKALENVVALSAEHPGLKFIAENVEAVKSSFRWPSVKRLKEEEKAAAIMEAMLKLSDGNQGLADFLVKNEEEIVTCYQAGKEKRVVPQETLDKLAAARDKRLAELRAKREATEATEGKAAA